MKKEKQNDEIEKNKVISLHGKKTWGLYFLKIFIPEADIQGCGSYSLKIFHILDFTNPKQGVYLDLKMNVTLGKKKVKPFASVASFP